MTTQQLIGRAHGIVRHNDLKRITISRLVYALQPSSVKFCERLASVGEPDHQYFLPAHVSGVNALTIDKFEGRYLLSGGADSSIALWDLESHPPTHEHAVYTPMSAVRKTAEAHKLGITQITFYPFDSLAFLTSSYDHTVKIYSSETLAPSATFNLDSVVYNISLSPIASHLLVACATQSPLVRLIDLRSGANTHTLAGHSGAILSTGWSPTREHILASGAADGSVRLWDVRRSVSELGILNLEDSTGMLGKPSSFSRYTVQSRAHRGPVNGVAWTADGRHILTCGHDQRIRLWNADTGANTCTNFGPMIRNSGLAPCTPILVPMENVQPEKDIVFYPNEQEILGYELFEGKLMRRLRRPQQEDRVDEAQNKDQRNLKDKITALAWRSHDVELYSAHTDGAIAAWKPRTEEDAVLDEEDEQEREALGESKKRKRGVLDDIYQDLTKKQIAFGNL